MPLSADSAVDQPVAFSLDLPSGLVAHGELTRREQSDHLIVFLPGAISPSSVRQIPFYHRHSWHEDLQDTHVLTLTDPSLGVDERLLGGWFVHPNEDILAHLSTLVDDARTSLGLNREHVTVYGSSLGGFGGLCIAALLPGVRAIAEVPQLELERWPIESALRLIEEALLGEPLGDFRRRHPERVNVWDRFRHAGTVPDFTIVTNTTDHGFEEQLEFMRALPRMRNVTRVGGQRLLITSATAGHRGLGKPDALAIIRAARTR